MKKEIKIMAHLVSHYPDAETSYNVAIALAKEGASYLEVQFPFSDPSADGNIIQQACVKALEKPDMFTVKKGFSLIYKICSTLKKTKLAPPLFVMTYVNIVVNHGITEFVQKIKKAGAEGIIVPDLPFDSDLGIELIKECRIHNLNYIPVIVINTKRERIKKILLATKAQYMYISLRVGITGSVTEITPAITRFLQNDVLKNVKVLGGFGIQNAKQVTQLQKYLHSCVVGSSLVESIKSCLDEGDAKNIVLHVKRRFRSLLPHKG